MGLAWLILVITISINMDTEHVDINDVRFYLGNNAGLDADIFILLPGNW